VSPAMNDYFRISRDILATAMNGGYKLKSGTSAKDLAEKLQDEIEYTIEQSKKDQ